MTIGQLKGAISRQLQLTEKIRKHLVPPRPIVVDVLAPDVNPVRDILLLKDPLECERISEHVILPGALAHGDDDAALAVLIEIPGILQVSKIGQGRIEIDIVIHIIADEHIESIQAAESDDSIEEIGMAEEKIRGMIRAHADSRV